MSSILDRFVHLSELRTIRARCQNCTASNGVTPFDLGNALPLNCVCCRRPLWSAKTQGVARIMGETRQGLAEFYEMLVTLEVE